MEFDKSKKSAYLKGYTDLSDLDKALLKYDGTIRKSDWEKEGKKLIHEYSDDLVQKGMMYTDTDNSFRYSKDIDTTFDDPTYLGYTLRIEAESSALWNYGVVDLGDAGETGSALKFINSYSNISEIYQRKDIWFEFINRFDQIFSRTLEYLTKNKKSYYVETISGLDKLNAKMVKYNGEDKLTITLSEDVSLKATYLAELYNNLCYSYNNQRYVMPENTLRFDLLIEISDIRVFRQVSDSSGVTMSSINSNPPKMIYRLHDCNFDFFNSKPFAEAISMAGYGSRADATPRNLTFDIKYKSITREFSSPLLNAYNLFNKGSQIVDNKYLSNAKYFNDILYSERKIQAKTDQNAFSNNENLTTQQSLTNVNEQVVVSNPPTVSERDVKLQDMSDEWNKGLGSSITSAAITNVQEYGDKLLGRFREIRGALLNEMIRQIREPFQMPRIYPDNVYAIDFRTLSLQNFVNGLGSDVLNILSDTGTDTVNNLGLSVEGQISNLLGGLGGGH